MLTQHDRLLISAVIARSDFRRVAPSEILTLMVKDGWVYVRTLAGSAVFHRDWFKSTLQAVKG